VTSETSEPAEVTEGQSPAAASDAWRQALTTRRTQQRDGQGVPGAQATRIPEDVSRRSFILGSFWTGLGVSLLGGVGILLDFLYPRNVKGFGGPVPAGKVSDFALGSDPKHFPVGQFWMVNLDPGETRAGGSGGGEGLMAMWHRCPHLGCTVPWRAGFTYDSDKGWFRCPCHGSTYTKAGVRVFGPAPRSLDTMKIDVDASGNITVQTGDRTPGGVDNPQRAQRF
jgi:cytochrome b6-f complex iron-sulfur subunit